MTQRPTVFIVDDEPMMTQSLRWLIESNGLAAETFNTAGEFLTAYTPDRPGCLLIDVRMPGMSGLDLQEQLAAQSISIPVIIVTGHGDVSTAVRAMKRGAFDFIEKPFSEQFLLERIQHALAADECNRRARARRAAIESKLATLTPRERQVMDLVVSGKPNKQIASALGRSQKTVEIHRANVMKKMGADSLAELVRMVQEHAKLRNSGP